jgi:hypothetical protein
MPSSAAASPVAPEVSSVSAAFRLSARLLATGP